MYAIICARKGSTRIKNKNIRLLGDKPLIQHTIDFAKCLNFIKKIYVNSDCNKILKIASDSNCVTYRRPNKFGKGDVFVVDVIKEMISSESIIKKNFLIMFPTVPFRNKIEVISAYKIFSKNKFKNQVVSVSPTSYPYQVSLKLKNNKISPIFPDFYNKSTRHTDYSKSYNANYAFVFSSGCTLIKNKTLIKKKALSFITNPLSSIDIDDEFQFTLAEAMYERINK